MVADSELHSEEIKAAGAWRERGWAQLCLLPSIY